MRILSLAVGVFFFLSSAAEARYCSNPNCGMCNRLFGPMHSVAQSVVLPEIDGTPHEVIPAILDTMDLGPNDVLYDLGCGDGRILIAAVRRFGCRGVGIEIDPRVASIARDATRAAGLGRIRIVQGDARRFLLDGADLVYMYLFPRLMAELVPRTDAPIVSYSHDIPGRAGVRQIGTHIGAVYVAPARPINLRAL